METAMSAIDLANFSKKQLDSLASDAQTEIVSRERTRRSDLRRSLEDEIKANGYRLSDLFPELAKPTKVRRASGPVRFRDPQCAQHTWTGIGRAPNWIRSILDERGITLAQFRALPMYLIAT